MHWGCAECSLGASSCPAASLLLQLDSTCISVLPCFLVLQEAVHRRTASSGSLMGVGAPPADGGSGGGGGGGSSSIFHRVSSIKNMLTGQSSK